MGKEQYWSKFADDFEKRNNYVVGNNDIAVVHNQIKCLSDLGNALELGCGNGTYSNDLSLNSKVVLATDFSIEMVKIATVKLNSCQNVFVEKADCFDLLYDNESFDTVFMANLLHIISNPEKALIESHRVLKSKGRIVLLDFGTEGMSITNKLKLFYRYLKTYGKPSKNRQKLTILKINNMLEEVGFKIDEASLIGGKMKAAFIIAVKQ